MNKEQSPRSVIGERAFTPTVSGKVKSHVAAGRLERTRLTTSSPKNLCSGNAAQAWHMHLVRLHSQSTFSLLPYMVAKSQQQDNRPARHKKLQLRVARSSALVCETGRGDYVRLRWSRLKGLLWHNCSR